MDLKYALVDSQGKCAEETKRVYLLCLQADRCPVAAVSDKMFAVIPQKTVRNMTDKFLGSSGDLLSGQRLSSQGCIHCVEQNRRSKGKILHCVDPDQSVLVDHTEKQSLVRHNFLDLRLVARQSRQYVRHKVRDFVVTEINAKMREQSARHLQQIPALEVSAVLAALCASFVLR